jgi:hypothetical protein
MKKLLLSISVFMLLCLSAQAQVEQPVTLTESIVRLAQITWADSKDSVAFIEKGGRQFFRPSRGQVSGTLRQWYHHTGRCIRVYSDKKNTNTLYFEALGGRFFEILLPEGFPSGNIEGHRIVNSSGLWFIEVWIRSPDSNVGKWIRLGY